MYKTIIRPLLFLFQPETSHQIVFTITRILFSIPGVKAIVNSLYEITDKTLERDVFGLTFKNPIGLAAGFDKDAKLIKDLKCFGFGFIEIGTVTPKGQSGNTKPRLFRIPADHGLINRMGFNNDGVRAVVQRLRHRPPGLIIGGNIGKNKATPNENAVSDYEICFKELFDVVDYFVVNVSSPNTPNLRELQEKEHLKVILNRLQELNTEKEKQKPILLKIAPDLTNEQLDAIIEVVGETKIHGVIATNTTISREDLKTNAVFVDKIGDGGISGGALRNRSTEVIRYLAQKSNKAFPIIGVGGVFSAQDALDKIDAGADLVQVYTGFIYEGPALVRHINKAIINQLS